MVLYRQSHTVPTASTKQIDELVQGETVILHDG